MYENFIKIYFMSYCLSLAKGFLAGLVVAVGWLPLAKVDGGVDINSPHISSVFI